MFEILSNKWMSLFCVMVNSVFASIAWAAGDYVISVLCYALAFYCGHNFMIGIKEDYYDKDRK